MPVIDLTRYIVSAAGTWTDPTQHENMFGFTKADTTSPERLLLRWAGDFVALTGPVRLRVTVQSENMTVPLALVGNMVPTPEASAVDGVLGGLLGGRVETLGNDASNGPTPPDINAPLVNAPLLGLFGHQSALGLQASTIYSYTLDVAAGQAWPFSLSEELSARRLRGLGGMSLDQLGNNLGFRVMIEPAFTVPDCTPVSTTFDLPCDFAVADRPGTAAFFPVACEPCEGSVIGLPPAGSVSLITPAADGGCVRTRFFNGMFITREDLEAEQRYHRVKSRLHNRAAGAGVVWGLGVGKQGNEVCVLPGYGVDCCGNDLALTSTYQVSIAALLADPAAARLVHKQGRQALSLLLEYVECPSDPRPVHGDVCSPEASRCEMSRIRESVRLRLVPPCEHQPSNGPIHEFLEAVRSLSGGLNAGKVKEEVASVTAPFRLKVEVAFAGTSTVFSIRPVKDGMPFDKIPERGWTSFSVQAIPDALWTFVGGMLSATAGEGAADVVRQTLSADGKPKKMTLDIPANATTFSFKFSDWRVQSLFARPDDLTLGGSFEWTTEFGEVSSNSVELSGPELYSLPLNPRPCDDPCFPGRIEHPTRATENGQAAQPETYATGPVGNPKTWLLATIGAWLSQMLVREGAGTPEQITSARREIAQGTYRLVWLLLFGATKWADSAALGALLRRLLEGWCDGLLWTGPRCCCDPHGVVIGCASVEGGTLQSIDPFGGRRHVIHYPLLSHWGSTLGITPPDITASELFSKLCCIAALPGPDIPGRKVPTYRFNIGSAILAVGDPEETAKRLMIRSRRSVGLPEMIATAVSLFTSSSAEQSYGFDALILSDFVADQTVMLLIPNETPPPA